MDAHQSDNRLFGEFPPVPTQEWENALREDLKGADYEEKLVWKTREGFAVKPYYRSGDLSHLDYLNVLPGEFPFVRGNHSAGNNWYIRQDIEMDDIAAANKKALSLLMNGVTSLGFIFKPGTDPTLENIEKVCENIYADAIEMNFICEDNARDIVRHIESLARKYNRDFSHLHGSVEFDPLGWFTLRGKFEDSEQNTFDQVKQVILAAKNLVNYRVITVNGRYFHNSGATLAESLAFSLAQGTNYLTRLTDLGLSVNDVAPRIKFNFSVGPNYFQEIAKFRAARLLWAHIVKAYGISDAARSKMHIHAESSRWNKSMYDPFVNMLRTTTENMSAIIGSVDSLTVLPYNAVYEAPTLFSERIARNQQLLLKEESYFDQVADPAAGSYYLENLTDHLAEQAWKLFLEVQEKGGFLEAFRSGYIQEKIMESARQRDLDIATRKELIIGTNQYPDITEVKKEPVNMSFLLPMNQQEVDTAIPTLKPYRGAQAFERLRYATDRYASMNERPRVFLVTLGNLAMRRARAQFASNFFGCAGYEIIDNAGFKSVEDAARACLDSGSEIAVICSSDEEYGQLAPQLAGLLRGKVILVLAGYPKDLVEDLKQAGFEYFIHIKSNILETLQQFQRQLGIN